MCQIERRRLPVNPTKEKPAVFLYVIFVKSCRKPLIHICRDNPRVNPHLNDPVSYVQLNRKDLLRFVQKFHQHFSSKTARHTSPGN